MKLSIVYPGLVLATTASASTKKCAWGQYILCEYGQNLVYEKGRPALNSCIGRENHFGYSTFDCPTTFNGSPLFYVTCLSRLVGDSYFGCGYDVSNIGE
ncbi:hypothetical protein Ptr902_00269 [Pyrenophora tritici-repentis]|nr:hypothetical protein PtrV1_02642 [Pyrenophora tritici-repentis]KAF7455409.1 hypothetical protein A1F99_026670 [Pyrenophora tritici-repentis]KAI0583153.1 hypothetical protein Alg130_05800 [Pyrenophora tritici-repentis]KAI0610070.1 hypothetical protein TUN205_05668 [Pyrenophora tritici-repentis]KAI0621993.1 hypothetical protein TUN199_06001 [Pyrenophora tritici-repentis]